MKNNSEPRVAGFFAGVGGIERGFDRAGFNSVWSNELDPQASKTYSTNHASELVVGDIGSVDSADVPAVDVIVGGFPCQAFSVAGHRKGFQDERGEVFFELARIIREKKPEAIFIENVKNLRGHDGGNTFKVIMANLEDAGYHLTSKVLNAKRVRQRSTEQGTNLYCWFPRRAGSQTLRMARKASSDKENF